MMEFKYPFVLYLGPFLLLLFWFIFSKKGWGKRYAVHPWVTYGKGKKIGWFRRLVIKLISLTLLISVLASFVALAWPLGKEEKEEIKDSVHVIFIVLDVSGSMQGSSLYAVTDIAKKFVRSRKGDLIGIIPFDSEVINDLVVSLTTDTEYLEKALSELAFYFGGSTGIGEGLFEADVQIYQNSIPEGKGIADAVRLREAIQSKEGWDDYASHVIRLLGGVENTAVIVFTDSGNNSGISPLAVLRFNQEAKIKTYAIRKGVKEDKIFQDAIYNTGGRPYNADNMADVANFFQEINDLERKEEVVEIKYFRKPEYRYPLFVSLVCLFLSLLFSCIVIILR